MLRQVLMSATLALVLTAGAFSAPPEVVPVPQPDPVKWQELKVAANAIVVLSAQPASEWDVATGPQPYTFESGRYAAFLLPEGGTLRVTITGPDKTKTRLLLTAGASPPPDPVNDPLAEKIKAELELDKTPAARKAKQVLDLAAVYKQIAKTCQDPTITTANQLMATARQSAAEMVDNDPALPKGTRVLAGVRDNVVSKEVALIFPKNDVLTQQQRDAATALFTRLALILEAH